MLPNYLASAGLALVGTVAITLIWSRFNGLRTILVWCIAALLGVASWWVYITFEGGVVALLGLVILGLYMALLDWHSKAQTN